jgi:hypothetical protein
MSIAALYVRDGSTYSQILGVDCWPRSRDARLWPGGAPAIAHPPCRAWGKYKSWAKPDPGERELAPFAVQQVRRNRGVVEHPVGSALWSELALPLPGDPPDDWGGYSVCINQADFGHRGLKPTLLYCVGVTLPPVPCARSAVVPVEKMGRPERERTPILLAVWLAAAAFAAR